MNKIDKIDEIIKIVRMYAGTDCRGNQRGVEGAIKSCLQEIFPELTISLPDPAEVRKALEAQDWENPVLQRCPQCGSSRHHVTDDGMNVYNCNSILSPEPITKKYFLHNSTCAFNLLRNAGLLFEM